MTLQFSIYSDLSMKTHLTKLCQSTYLYLRNIGRIRKLLDEDSVKILVQSLILIKIDVCNSLLLGIPNQILERLQKTELPDLFL